MLGGQLGSTSHSILCLAIGWAACCVEPLDRQHLCLVTSALLGQHVAQHIVLSGVMGGMMCVGRPVG